MFSRTEASMSAITPFLNEASFFNKGIWSEFPRDHVGIESLRSRLSVLLFHHIKNELPELRAELDKKLSKTTKELGRLGTRRSTVGEQRHYLLKLSMLFYNTAKAALHGHYDAEYSEGKEDFEDAVGRLKARRLRAMIQYMNKRFAAQLRREGPKYKFEGDDFFDIDSDNPELPDKSGGTSKSKGNASSESNMPSKPIVLGRRQALEWVEKTLIQTRGRELAGNFNPLLIGELFWEQSQNWEIIAQKYTEEISQLCDNFVGDLLQELCPKDIYARIRFGHIQNVLKERLQSSQAELKKLIAGKRLYPMTYNHYYTTTIQKVRSQRAQKKLEECIAEATTTATYYTYNNPSYQPVMIDRLDKRLLKRLCSERITENMDEHSCSDALDCLHTYYKVALKMFTDMMPLQVIERHLIKIFSPLTMSQFSDAEISSLASEPEGVMKHRQHLEGREKVLEKGSEVFSGVLRANG